MQGPLEATRGRHDVRRLPRGRGADAPARPAGGRRRRAASSATRTPTPIRRSRSRCTPATAAGRTRCRSRSRSSRGPPGEQPSFDEAARTLRVPLPKAERATVRLVAAPVRQGAARRHGRLALGRGADRRRSSGSRATGGTGCSRRGPTSRSCTPCSARCSTRPSRSSRSTRGPGATSAAPRFIARCSIKSTDRIDLRAEWHEPSDDPAAAASAARPPTGIAATPRSR